MRLSLFEGAFYALMVGFGETYFLADAVRLGASALEIALVVSLPLFLGAAGPLLTLYALPRLGARRRWTVAMTSLQCAALLLIVALDWQSLSSPSSLILCVCLYQMGGLGAAVAWNSWFGDLVTPSVRGRYFAKRSRIVQVALCLSVIAAGLLLQWLEPARAGVAASGSGRGFMLLFLLAATARLVSSVLLASTWEPRFHRPASVRQLVRIATGGRGRATIRLLLCAAALQAATYIASPFFVPFMLEELEFTYVEFMLATLAVMAGKFLFFPAWGRTVDRFGARPGLMLAATMVALVPLPWLFARGLGVVIFAQLLSGATWSGWEISYFSILVENSVKRTRAYVFAFQSVLNGGAQLLGSTLGGLLLQVVDGRFVIAFSISALLRLAVVSAFPRFVPASRSPTPRRRDLVLRAIGFRPSGGIAHRPVIVGEEESGAFPDEEVED